MHTRQRRKVDDVVVRRPVEVVDVEKLVDVAVLVVLVFSRFLLLLLFVGRAETFLSGSDGCQRSARDARAENIPKFWSKLISISSPVRW